MLMSRDHLCQLRGHTSQILILNVNELSQTYTSVWRKRPSLSLSKPFPCWHKTIFFWELYSPVPLSDFYNTDQIGHVSFLTVVTMILQIKEVQPRVRESALKCLFYLNSLKNEKTTTTTTTIKKGQKRNSFDSNYFFTPPLFLVISLYYFNTSCVQNIIISV